MVSPTASICETYRHSEQKQSQKFCGSKEDKNGETHPIWAEKGETGCVLGAGESSSGWRRMKLGEKIRSPNQSGHYNHATRAKRKPAETQSFRRFCGRGRRTCLGCRLGRRWTVATGDQRPTTRTAGGPAGAPLCQILPHTNEKSQVPHKRYLTFLAGAEGLSLAGRLGRFAAERHWRSLTPRHAVLEWMLEQPTRSGEGPVLPVFFCKTKTCGAGLVLFGSPVPKHALKVHWKSLSE